MKLDRLRKLMLGVLMTAASLVAVSFDSVDASTAPTVTWKVSTLEPATSYTTFALVRSNSTGRKTLIASGACSLKSGRIVTKRSGFCTVKLLVKAKKPYASKTFVKRFLVKAIGPTPTTMMTSTQTATSITSFPTTTTALGGTFVPPAVPTTIDRQPRRRTTANGLASNNVSYVYVSGSMVYAATDRGLSISTDGGNTFTNRTTANGLGSNKVAYVYASGSTVYAVTIRLQDMDTDVIYDGGLSISTNGGATFTNQVIDYEIKSMYSFGTTVFTIDSGRQLRMSTDSGNTFTNRTTASGLGSNSVPHMYVSGSMVYAATGGGLSISTDGGNTFTNRTTANGLPSDEVNYVAIVGSTIYAGTPRGLAISNDGGSTFIRRTMSNGLPTNDVRWILALGSTLYISGGGRSTDGGTTFVERYFPACESPCSIFGSTKFEPRNPGFEYSEFID